MTTFSRLADLPVTIEALTLAGLERRVSSNFLRRTTVVGLSGAGHTGVGEDVAYEADEQTAFRHHGIDLPVRGRFTLAAFSSRLDSCELFPRPPRREASRDYRRWAFESAALDLALRQAGRTLAEVLDREPRPLTFVVSTSLGRPPTTKPLERLLAHCPGLGFKLDASAAWDAELIERIRATARVHVVDFKGAYRGTDVDQPPDPGLYRRVVEGFPEAWLEDPHRHPECLRILAPHRQRVTWDAPIHSVADIQALDEPPRALNIKPSRFGSLERLFEAYDYCEANGIRMYGGGQFELGPGRGQIQYLAALFHPDEGNDVAPRVFNERRLPPEVPASPLAPAADDVGFYWHDAGPPGAGRPGLAF